MTEFCLKSFPIIDFVYFFKFKNEMFYEKALELNKKYENCEKKKEKWLNITDRNNLKKLSQNLAKGREMDLEDITEGE